LKVVRKLTGKAAIVTGTAQGIGRATATVFAQEAVRVHAFRRRHRPISRDL